MKPPLEYSAFISYASENREKAEAICASLEQRGRVCWIAPRDIRAGREYGDEIILGLERSAALILVLSEAANTSVFVLREVERAVSKDINVVPVRIEEVTPSPGLELFISGTHWLDVWRGDWDAHMDRLVRDLGDGPAGGATAGASARRSVVPPRSLSRMYVAAGLVLAVAVSSMAIWAFARQTPEVQPPASRDVIPVGAGADPRPSIIEGPAIRTTGEPRVPEASGDDTPVAEPPPAGRRRSRDVPPARRQTREAARPAADTSGELNALRDDYDNLSLRGSVIDDALNQLWEEMKPNSPRLDMATHQRSLRANLARGRDALAERDAARARRFLDNARADLVALEQFMNR
jgi:hypothetical protein